ncbi:unnamed protein product [Orchesella dallaii]|uniref:Uncharacterized protein n=1 Tax=Orchesella dallaii TaxID=48710 RepID=A0ABP1RG96_9HEXA
MERRHPEVVPLDELEIQNECDIGCHSLTTFMIDQDEIGKESSPSAGENKSALGNNTDVEQERQAIASERRELERSKSQLQRKRKEFDARKKATKNDAFDQQGAITSMKMAYSDIENATQKLMAAEKLETEAAQHLQELLQKEKDAVDTLRAKKAEIISVAERTRSAIQQMEDNREAVDQLKRSRTIAEGRLVVLKRLKEKEKASQPQE